MQGSGRWPQLLADPPTLFSNLGKALQTEGRGGAAVHMPLSNALKVLVGVCLGISAASLKKKTLPTLLRASLSQPQEQCCNQGQDPEKMFLSVFRKAASEPIKPLF